MIVTLMLGGDLAFGEPPSRVPIASIGIDVELIGRSGMPLGTVFTVEAKIVIEKAKHHKEGDRRFILIRAINGEPLKTPKRIILWDEAGQEENEWKTMRVIEDATYSLAFTPNLNIDSAKKDKGRQTIYSGIRIIE